MLCIINTYYTTMDKEEHLKQHWIEMNNTHSNKLQQKQMIRIKTATTTPQQQHLLVNNGSKPGLISVTSVGSDSKLAPKSLTSTPNNNCHHHYGYYREITTNDTTK